MAAPNPLVGWERFFQELETFLQTLNFQFGTASESFCRYASERLEVCCGSISDLLNQLRITVSGGSLSDDEACVVVEYCTSLAEVLQSLQAIGAKWESCADQSQPSSCYAAQAVPTGGRGRPKFNISRDQIEYLASMSFNWTQIADMHGVSRMTIYRRRQDFGLNSPASGELTDDELRVLLNQI